MPFTVIYPQTAFAALGGNSIKPRALEAEVRAQPSITTVLDRIRVANPGSGSTPEVDDPTGRTWAFIFAGAGPLSGPETAALDAVVAAHSGTELVSSTSITFPSGATASLGVVNVGQVLARTAAGVISGVTAAVNTVQYAEIASASQTSSVTSYANITGLSALTVESGKSYRFEGVIHFSMSGTSGSPGVAINGPITNVAAMYTIPKTATATLARHVSTVDAETDSTNVTITANTILPFHILGRFTASSSGAVALRIKRYGSGTVSIRDYSWLRLEELPS